MKAKIQMGVVIVLALLLSMLMGILVTRVAASSVIWKQNCPLWADLEIVQDHTDRHVICSVGDHDDIN